MTGRAACRTAAWRGLAAATLALAAFGCAHLKPAPPLPPPQPRPFGSVMVDAGRRELILTGFVNQVSGPVELLACGTRGKTHESVLVLMARPHDIQAGLLLLGLKHGPPMPGVGMGPPQGDRVSITVQWEQEGRLRTRPAEELLLDVKTGRPLRHGGWVFNGSTTEDGRFKAMEEETYIATYWDPWGIINLAAPLGADDERVAVNRDAVPPLHAPVTLVIRPAGAR